MRLLREVGVIPEAAQRLSGIHSPGGSGKYSSELFERSGLWIPGSRFARPGMTSINVLLKAMPFLQVGDEGDRFIGGTCAVLRHDIDQRALDVLRHVLGVAAPIDISTVGEPSPPVA